jgi:hypothetical protein
MSWALEIWRAFTTPMQSGAEDLKKFTPRAQEVLRFAREEAVAHNHNFVGTEHLLLGLIRLAQGTAFNVLQSMGLDLEKLRQEVERQVGTGPEGPQDQRPPYTPRVKKVLSIASKEASMFNQEYVGTEAVLLGLLLEGDGVAARVLKSFDVKPEIVRQVIVKQFNPNHKPEPALAGNAPWARQADADAVDITKRYDIFVQSEGPKAVYSNAQFKGIKKLLPQDEPHVFADYIEIELDDGTTVFISRPAIVKFSEHRKPPAD